MGCLRSAKSGHSPVACTWLHIHSIILARAHFSDIYFGHLPIVIDPRATVVVTVACLDTAEAGQACKSLRLVQIMFDANMFGVWCARVSNYAHVDAPRQK